VSYGGDLTLISHAIDINYTGKLFNILNFGIGPSFILTNRIFEITVGSTETLRPLTVYDRLASSGLGVNGFFGVTVPFTENEKYFFLISNIKFRYAYSLWYDKGIRNLDNYYQEFLTMQFSFGFGYSF